VKQLIGVTTLSDRDTGFLLGVLTGEGHFGGDGRQPQVTLRMHTRHARLFSWLLDAVPGSRLYGPYDHGGRSYYQWMVRGQPLRTELLPILRANRDLFDDAVRERFDAMCADYHLDRDEPPDPYGTGS